MKEFGAREFQLHMLAMMPYTDAVKGALVTLNADQDEARQCLGMAQDIGLFQVPHSIDRELSILGLPGSEFDTEEDDELPPGLRGSKTMSFDLEVFRGFRYLVNVMPDGTVWEQRLDRAKGVPVPTISSLDDLTAWRFVKHEVLTMLEAAELIDGFSFQEVFSGNMENVEAGRTTQIICRFDFHLLQTVTVV